MRKLVILFILAQILLVTHQAKLKAGLQQLRGSNFGRTVLQTIQMSIEADDPVGNLLDIFQNLLNNVEKQIVKYEEQEKKQRQTCDSDLQKLEDDLEEAKIKSKTYKAEIDELQPLKDQSTKILTRKQQELKELNQELQRQFDIRNKQKETFEATIDEYERTLLGFAEEKSEANKEIDEFQKARKVFNKPEPIEEYEDDESSDEDEEESSEGYSFLQVNHRLTKYIKEEDIPVQHRKPISFVALSSRLSKLKRSVQHAGIRSIIQTLTQISNKANSHMRDDSAEAEVLTKKVGGVLSEMETFITEERTALEQSEALRENIFKDYEEEYTEQILKVQEDLTYIQSEIDSYNSNLKDRMNEKFEIDNKVDTKSKELEDRQAECTTNEENNKVELEKLWDEKKTLEIAIDLVATKLGQLKKQLLSKQDSDDGDQAF